MTSIERDRADQPIARPGAAGIEHEAPSPRMIMRQRALTHPGFLFGGVIMLLDHPRCRFRPVAHTL